MKYLSLFVFMLIANLTFPTVSIALDIKITPDIESVKVMHNGKKVTIQRNQNPNNLINPEFAKTSRRCPPFCIHPMILTPGIETVAELEVLNYLKKMGDGDNSILVIDSRTIDWVIKGSIPGAVNIPWDIISGPKSSPSIVKNLLEKQLGVKMSKHGKEFGMAKTLILFCNGSWCDQSPVNIRTLLELGYPPDKLKWYRGGMQSWESLGLTTVTDIFTPQPSPTGAIAFKAVSQEKKAVAKISKGMCDQFGEFFTALLWGTTDVKMTSDIKNVKITSNIESVKVMHDGKEMTIQRNQDPNNQINPEFAKTSRPCPPFCIHPMILTPGIEIVAELEVLDYLKKISDGDTSILVIDSRTPEWVVKDSIPGVISIPWDILSGSKSSPPIVKKLLEEQLGVKMSEDGKYFGAAKTLILFCNGPWCDQSPANIQTLLELGYPPEKLKWYRGGMQAWDSLGLTTVTDIPMPWLGF